MKETQKEVLHFEPKTQFGAGDCLGDIFPNIQKLFPNAINRGRVFSVLVESHGMGFPKKVIHQDKTAWKKCLECSVFDRCLQIGMANLLFQHALDRY